MNVSEPTVGILIDSYNTAPWLRACVDSALAQTRPADEIIVYDDGSTDDSLAILRSYGDRIRLIEGVHDFTRSGRASQSAAVAAAFAASTADHLYLLDGDDAYLPTHLADYEVAWAAHPEANMLQCPMTHIDAQGRVLGVVRDPRKHRSDYLADIYRTAETDFFYLNSALAFRRDYLVHAFPLIERLGMDYFIDGQLALHAFIRGPVHTLDESSMLYRVRLESLGAQYGLRNGLPVHEARARARCFNLIAAHHGLPPLRLWLSFAHLQRVARLWLPEWLALPFVRLKIRIQRVRG